jgi:hypothetical protein
MNDPKGTAQPLDLNSIRINAAYDNLAQSVKEQALKAANYAGELGRTLAEKAQLEERVKALEAEIAGLKKAKAETA